MTAKVCALTVAALLPAVLDVGSYASKAVQAGGWQSLTQGGVPLGMASAATRINFVTESETPALLAMLLAAGVPVAAGLGLGASRSVAVAAALAFFKGMAGGNAGPALGGVSDRTRRPLGSFWVARSKTAPPFPIAFLSKASTHSYGRSRVAGYAGLPGTSTTIVYYSTAVQYYPIR